MKEPLVSVKMITYNHAPYIAKAIEGVLQQKTNFPFELVIGEDCSTDGTREIVFEYQKKYPEVIRVITSEKNVGMKKNGYRITKACRGKYIAFCEGDDYWHNLDKLQKQVDYLESHPECGLIYSSYDVIHVESGEQIKDFVKYKNYVLPDTPSMADIVEGKGGLSLGLLTCTVMLRRLLYDQIVEADPYLHQSDNFLMGDTQIWAEMAAMAILHYIPESMATHIITDESATRSTDPKKVLRFHLSGKELMLYLCDKYNISSSIRRMHEVEWYNISLRLALLSRNEDMADEVRKKKQSFTWKEWLRYYGAKSMIVHYLYRTATFVPNLFRKKKDPWL